MKILIATGGSAYSFMAVEKACEMVIDPKKCQVRIISVYPELAASAPEPLAISTEQIRQLEDIGRKRSTGYALNAGEIIKRHFPDEEIDISMTAVKGPAKKMVIEEAEKWGADLIVVGSLGHNFLSRMFLGSVPDAVVKYAPCSVLIVRGDVEKREPA